MNCKSWTPLVLALSALLSNPLAHAQGVLTPLAPTLKSAFDAAWARQPEAAAADARRQAAAARQAAAGSWTAEPPALEISAKSDRLNRNGGSREYEVGMAVPLWLPGERGRTQALAAAEAGAVGSRVAAAEWRVAGAVREAWWGVHRARLESGLARTRQAGAAQLAKDVARRVAAGDLSKADQHQADGALAAAQAEVADGLAAQAQAEQALRALTAEPPAEALRDDAEPTPDLVDSGVLTEHPALRELSARTQVAERTSDLVRLQKRANPELTLATTRERGAFGESYGQTVTVGLRFPFGSSNANQARQASAGADLIEAQALLALERQRLTAEIASARERLAAAQAGSEAAAKRAELARETRGFVEKSFRLGETDLPSRLRVELEAFEAERQSTRARLNVHQSLSALRQALGLLPQ